ncbi:hypothetical protein psyc5s11_29080 [Clostridium gelidum]|uniref:Uncharacterized protein n=1 Tax=Clostridium gelidum TaxID=704125 RepID=A0ABN6IYW0_9CLOT|nr:hypothetical protein [Clostridium gelidum]BCZ46841.1 hypothetical protein psyc5s11_29080 [Clostridium gelidum]
MKLTKYQEDLLDNTDKLMKVNNLKEEEDYAKFFSELGDLRTGSKEIIIALQLKNEESTVKQLKKLGWKTGHKYYTNGQVRNYSDGDSKDDYGNIEMIQLVFK